MTEEQLAKAREAKSPEELLALAKENGMEDFTEEDAEDFYAQMHTSGELTDEELENVSGGCSVKRDGNKYTVVTSDRKCDKGQWEDLINPGSVWSWKRHDHDMLRLTWHTAAEFAGREQRCGSCSHLGFKGGTGYCEIL